MRKASVVLALALALSPGVSHARLAVEVWTDKGNDAVYEPGDRMRVKVRTSEDAYLLVYEIDAEGAINVLFPELGGPGVLEGRQVYELPPKDSNVELIVREPVGQCYIVAIASANPLENLPWYLRPYNPQAEGVGYVGAPQEGEGKDEGVTAEGRIVGDPFVAMERIRRRVLGDPQDGETFSTAYTSYYVHELVAYPRYVCNDCHRPGRWAWWDGFDPYYTRCTVFDLRVNWGWYWGPAYWYGYVPYFAFVYRPTCPPRYYPYYQDGAWCSSWDGWTGWNNMWGSGTLVRYKSPPPPGYVPPPKFGSGEMWRPGGERPPGFLSTSILRGRGTSPLIPVGRSTDARGEGGGAGRVERPTGGSPRQESPAAAGRGGERRSPAVESPRQEYVPVPPVREEARPVPQPAVQSPRQEPSPGATQRSAPKPAPAPAPASPAPKQEPSRGVERNAPKPAPANPAPRQEGGAKDRSGSRSAPMVQVPRGDYSTAAMLGPGARPGQAARTSRYSRTAAGDLTSARTRSAVRTSPPSAYRSGQGSRPSAREAGGIGAGQGGGTGRGFAAARSPGAGAGRGAGGRSGGSGGFGGGGRGARGGGR